MAMDPEDLRAGERYRTAAPLIGSFGSAGVTLVDVSAAGAQIEHAQPLRIGSRARLFFRRAEVAVSVQASTVWSHLSKTPDAKGKYLYHSGLRLEGESREFHHALREMLEKGLIVPDEDSLQRKKQRAAAREAEKVSRPVMLYARPQVVVSPDQELLIQHARTRILSQPDQARRLYERAREAIAHKADAQTGDVDHREEVLAVWQYLEESISIAVIAAVFDR